jgi:hypothetical protein
LFIETFLAIERFWGQRREEMIVGGRIGNP